jgi:hypothetical protein
MSQDHDAPLRTAIARELQKFGFVVTSVLVSFGESLGPNDRVSHKVRDGAKQLMAHNSQGRAHHLLWLHAGGRDPEIQLEQFRSTLYGMTHIFGPDLPLRPSPRRKLRSIATTTKETTQ